MPRAGVPLLPLVSHRSVMVLRRPVDDFLINCMWFICHYSRILRYETLTVVQGNDQAKPHDQRDRTLRRNVGVGQV